MFWGVRLKGLQGGPRCQDSEEQKLNSRLGWTNIVNHDKRRAIRAQLSQAQFSLHIFLGDTG